MNQRSARSDVLYFLDVNVVANAAGNLGGVDDHEEWVCDLPGASTGIQVVNRLIDSGVRLATSQTYLETLRRTLCKQGARDYDGLDADSAQDTAAAFLALVHASNGIAVSADQVREYLPTARRAAACKIGGVERIDHEDLTIIAGVLATMAQDPDVVGSVLVTDDSGLLACARDLAVFSIRVISTRQMLALRASAFAA